MSLPPFHVSGLTEGRAWRAVWHASASGSLAGEARLGHWMVAWKGREHFLADAPEYDGDDDRERWRDLLEPYVKHRMLADPT